MYLKRDHFNRIMIDRFGDDYAQRFDHFERLSSKAVLYSSGENLAIIYVNTIVFLKTSDGVKLNTNGWYTNTTKKWINKGFDIIYKKAFIFQKAFNWYVEENGDVRDYQDNMILSAVNA